MPIDAERPRLRQTVLKKNTDEDDNDTCQAISDPLGQRQGPNDTLRHVSASYLLQPHQTLATNSQFYKVRDPS
jgi:hypothetical protein